MIQNFHQRVHLRSLMKEPNPVTVAQKMSGGGAKLLLLQAEGHRQWESDVHPDTKEFRLALVAMGFSFTPTARAQSPKGEEPGSSHVSGSTELSGAYRQWVNEDVRWIITPEEREAYLSLPQPYARDEFIRQFWERRNPTPGRAENLFKEEHYRRIAYANVHFAAGTAGWMSDRGRIYIVNGKPESIDSHPSGGLGESKPFEVWHYLQIQEPGPAERGASGLKAAVVIKRDVDFKFVDLCDCGDYQLQSRPTP
jgi:GWxTD domain-containing protein